MKPVCLTIAGSDSGGGAGIQADIKSMQANGVYAASVVTAVTAQNTISVGMAMDLPLDLIAAQIDSVASDMKIAVVKTGMLSSGQIIDLVAERLDRYGLRPVVVDPVMISKSGFSLLADDAVDVLVAKMLPLAYLLTPNAHEAERLTGMTIETLHDAQTAARKIHRMGAQNVLVKGGHLPMEEEAVDVLYDGSSFEHFRAERLATRNTHGTGCTYASAIAANLAKGQTLIEAVDAGKQFVTEAIRHGLSLGSGSGPTDHFFFLGGQ